MKARDPRPYVKLVAKDKTEAAIAVQAAYNVMPILVKKIERLKDGKWLFHVHYDHTTPAPPPATPL